MGLRIVIVLLDQLEILELRVENLSPARAEAISRLRWKKLSASKRLFEANQSANHG